MEQLTHGVDWKDAGPRLAVWAPRAKSLATIVGERRVPMHRRADGWFTANLGDAAAGTRYALELPDGRRRPDPASRAQPEGVHGDSALFDPRRHAWTDQTWTGIAAEALVFYELHVGTFTQAGTLDAAAGRLPELLDLGVTCVELMPVQPFAGNRNWGYDGVSLHAVHAGYGGPEALQRFVEAAHRVGLAVCLDVVYNHFGPEGNYLGEFGPYVTSRHRSPWGDGMNYDGPDAGPVRAYMVEAAAGWIRDFHVDALRLDAVHAIVDESPVHLVADICAAVEAAGRAAGRTVHVISESDLNDRKVVDAPPAGWGCTAAWSDDFHHAVHTLLTGEAEAFYADFRGADDLVRALRSGFVYQGQRSTFRGRAHGTNTRGLRPAQFVFCLQNHDQVGNRPHGERLSVLVPAGALEPLAALLLLGPGLPLLFMGEEYGERRPFQYFTSHSDEALGRSVWEGRRAEFIARGAGEVPDPQAASTFEASRLEPRAEGAHGLRSVYRRLLALRAAHRAEIGAHWPEVTRTGMRFDVRRPGLVLAANLGPAPAGGLPGWGWQVTERA